MRLVQIFTITLLLTSCGKSLEFNFNDLAEIQSCFERRKDYYEDINENAETDEKTILRREVDSLYLKRIDYLLSLKIEAIENNQSSWNEKLRSFNNLKTEYLNPEYAVYQPTTLFNEIQKKHTTLQSLIHKSQFEEDWLRRSLFMETKKQEVITDKCPCFIQPRNDIQDTLLFIDSVITDLKADSRKAVYTALVFRTYQTNASSSNPYNWICCGLIKFNIVSGVDLFNNTGKFLICSVSNIRIKDIRFNSNEEYIFNDIINQPNIKASIEVFSKSSYREKEGSVDEDLDLAGFKKFDYGC